MSGVSSATLPQLVTWSHFIPISALFGLNVLVFIVSIMSFGAGGGSQSRLLWAMTRDGFIKNKWLGQLSKNKAPRNALITQFVAALTTMLIVAGLMIKIHYGYNPTTITVGWFLGGAAGTII